MKTIIVRSNKSGLKAFKGGWTSCVLAEDGMYKVEVTKEQYEMMDGHEHDPWID